jgi:wyosine [tRNA(Phe)-imidazoG37] synthetase (radical SAM superfamily)
LKMTEQTNFKYLYGPVPSRRLGLSLGVDIIPAKYCTYDCIYCQVRKTDNLSIERKSFYPVDDIIEEIETKLSSDSNKPDRITFSGSGEPTLNIDIGKIINEIKKITDIPVAVITNGSLLWMPEVRQELLSADLVVPSMDSVILESFNKINKPYKELDLEKIKNGIIDFKKVFNRELWLEILLVKDINDDEKNIDALVEYSKQLKPDRIQLNTVARPPAYSSAQPVENERMKAIAKRFNPEADIALAYASKKELSGKKEIKSELILDMIKRRPCSIKDILDSLHYEQKEVIAQLSEFVQKDIAEIEIVSRVDYYTIKNRNSK